MARALVNVPKNPKIGDVIEIRTLAQHPMESGYRAGLGGEKIPRDIVRLFTCSFEGQEVFRADLSPAIAANPYLVFPMKVPGSGTLTLRWTGDHDFELTETVSLTVA